MISLNGRRQYALVADDRIVASADTKRELKALLVLGAPWDSEGRRGAVTLLVQWRVIDRHSSTQREVA